MEEEKKDLTKKQKKSANPNKKPEIQEPVAMPKQKNKPTPWIK